MKGADARRYSMIISRRISGKSTKTMLLLVIYLAAFASSFTLQPSFSPLTRVQKSRILPPQNSIQLAAVSEEQVEEALVKSEELWNRVLELRKNADEAAEKAEALRASSSTSQDSGEDGEGKHDTAHLNPNSISLASLGDTMEADQYVKEAEELMAEADSLEFKAKKALEETEMLLSQHLQDFPDSPLANDE